MRPFAAAPKAVLLPLACLAATVGLVACGGGDDGPDATVEEFVQAVADQDPGKACGLVSTESRDALGTPCEELLAGDELTDEQKQQAESATYETTEETDDTATVTGMVEGEEDASFQLTKEDGEWKIQF